MWHETGFRSEVTCIARSPQKDSFAVGYADGSIRLWSASSGSVITTFNGHKKPITALAFDEQGARLASGSQDTDLIVWDVVGEAGLFRSVKLLWCILYLTLLQASWSPRSNYLHKILAHLQRSPFNIDFIDFRCPDHYLQRHLRKSLGPFNATLRADRCCASRRHMGDGYGH